MGVYGQPRGTPFEFRGDAWRRLTNKTSTHHDVSEPEKEFPGPYDPERVRQLYTTTCELLDVMPCRRFLLSVRSGRVIAGHQGMGPKGARAVAISLIVSRSVISYKTIVV